MPSLWVKVHDLFSSNPYSFPQQRSTNITAQRQPYTPKLQKSNPQPGVHNSSVPDPMFGSRSIPVPVQVTPPDSRGSSRERGGPKGTGKEQTLRRTDATRGNPHPQDHQPYRDRGGVSAVKDRHSGTSTPTSAHLTPLSFAYGSSDVHRFRQDDKFAGGHIPRTLTREMSQEIINVARNKANLVDDNPQRHSQQAAFEDISPILAEQKRRTECTSLNDFIHAEGKNKDTSAPTGLSARPCKPGMCQACAVRPAVSAKSLPEIELALCVKCADEERKHRHRRRHHRHRRHGAESTRSYGNDSGRHHRRERRSDDEDYHHSRSHGDNDGHRSHRSGESSRSTRTDSRRKDSSRSRPPLPEIAEEPKAKTHDDYHHRHQRTGAPSSKVVTEQAIRCYVCGGPTASSPQRENNKEMNPLCSACYDKAFSQHPPVPTAATKQPKVRHLTPPVPAPEPLPTLSSMAYRKNPPPQPPPLNTGHPAIRHKEVPRREDSARDKEAPRHEDLPCRKDAIRRKEAPCGKEVPAQLVSPLSPPHRKPSSSRKNNRPPSPVSPLTRSQYYPADTSPKWAEASSVYMLGSPRSELPTPALPAPGRNYTASTYRGLLSQPPSEVNVGNGNGNGNRRVVDGANANGTGNGNGKVLGNSERESRDTEFYRFYDMILDTPRPAESSGNRGKDGSAKGKDKGKGKEKNAFQDNDWFWETY